MSTWTCGSWRSLTPTPTLVVSGESLDVRWWPTDALPEATRDELEPLVAVARATLGLP